jgi:ssDNA-binding Zn-finger/Zn-ribbon topoisomerase 1
MGHKKVCLDCKINFKRDFEKVLELVYPCPECGKPMILYHTVSGHPKRQMTRNRML